MTSQKQIRIIQWIYLKNSQYRTLLKVIQTHPNQQQI